MTSGFCIDLFEKKPLNHFHPGTRGLSFGTAGCNLGCTFCQNHEISTAAQMDALTGWPPPQWARADRSLRSWAPSTAIRRR